MSATPPEASTEYSKGPRGSGGGFPLGLGVAAAALLGALMLIVAEATALYTVHVVGAPTTSHSTGAHDGWALLPMAIVAALLGVAVWRVGSRPALLGVGVLGLMALLIALLGDLPDAHATGVEHGPGGRYVQAMTQPSAGFYLETGGAVLLVVASVSGFILAGPREPRTRHAIGTESH